jgi:hypothetical protein
MGSLFDSLIAKMAAGIMRHAVSGFCGMMLAHGFITKAQDEQAYSAILVLIPIGLSAYDKWSQQQKADAAILEASKAGQAALTSSPQS